MRQVVGYVEPGQPLVEKGVPIGAAGLRGSGRFSTAFAVTVSHIEEFHGRLETHCTASGSWVERRPDGEVEYPAGKDKGSTLIEDANTTAHWFFNDGSVPVQVLVCDIVPSPS